MTTSKRSRNEDSSKNSEKENSPKKHPKLPPNLLPFGPAQIAEEYAEECNHIEIFQNARRFEKAVVERTTNDDDDDDDDDYDDHPCRATELVEIYYDNDASNYKLKTTKGVHWRWFAHNDDDEESVASDESNLTESPVPNSWFLRPAPTIHHNVHASLAELQTHVDQLAHDLKRDGFQEVGNFLELHKRHLPCFTWVVSDDEISSEDILGSRIGGNPALYPDEAWPERPSIFCFQINLALVPRRMQCVTGSSGLFQFFWDRDAQQMRGHARLLPDTDLDKLVLRSDPDSSSDDATEIVPGAITGWVERADYPSETNELFSQPHLEEKSRDLHCGFNKFGGYANYLQDTEAPHPCECGTASHLGREETFHFCGNTLLRFMPISMGGQVTYCPKDSKRRVITRCTCT